MKPTRIYGVGRFEDRYITFGADPDILLHDYDEYVKFVKGCELAVRKDDRYTHYIAKIHEAGFNHCAVTGHVNDDENSKVKLEMHHGPIFNLFDICDIVLKAHLKRNDIVDLTTFDVADDVLTCHEKNMIQVAMINVVAHKAMHNKGGKNIFLSIKATIGRIDKFIDRYSDGMEKEHWEMIERYIEACDNAEGETLDQGLFDTAEKLRSFK
jgi:hypothetical protein